MSADLPVMVGTVLVLNAEEKMAFLRRYLQQVSATPVTENSVKRMEAELEQDGEELYFLRSSHYKTLRETLVYVAPKMADKSKLFHGMLYNEELHSKGVLYMLGQTSFSTVGNGDFVIFTDKPAHPLDIVDGETYQSIEEVVQEFRGKLEDFLPETFGWDSHIGWFQCVMHA